MAERGDSERQLKKSRLETIFTKFQASDKSLDFLKFYKQLFSKRVNSLVSLEITYCDAAAENGKTFSRATCHGKPVLEELFPFGSIFARGVDILNNFLKDLNDKHTPDSKEEVKLLIPLLTYLFDERSHNCLRRLDAGKVNKTELMVTLANHFFSKLSVTKGFTLDKFASGKESICKCGYCKKEEIMACFDDTSLGNKDVWHGTLDIILGSCDIAVQLTSPEPEDIPEDKSPEGQPFVEVKCNDLGSVHVRDQALAQTITFSFLQRQWHSLTMNSCLTPFILASNREIQYFFYDCDKDILLQSRKYSFFITLGRELVLNYKTIITAWFVLNYKYLCSGPTECMLQAPKAGFPEFAGPALEVYESNLKFKNVCETASERCDEALYDPTDAISEGLLDSCPFRWPAAPFVSNPFDVL